MNIFSQLEQMNDFTDNEKLIIEYMKTKPEEFVQMSAKQISQKCYVSLSTIYRLCDKLGFSGLSELKVQVSRSLHEYLQKQDDFDYNYPIKQNQTQYQMIHQLKKVYDQTIISTLNLMDVEQLNLIVQHMKKSKSIDLYASAGNIYFAQNFQFQMQEIGVTINVPEEEYLQRLLAASSDSSHFAIIISFGGRGVLVERLIHILKRKKTPIVLICGAGQNPYEKYANYHLYMNPYENHYHKISSFSTRLTLLYILDCIYTCYFELDYENNIQKKLNYYQYMKKGDEQL